MRLVNIFISIFLFVMLSGCLLLQSNVLVEEPAGGYAFEMPSGWVEMSSTDDLFSKDGDVVVYTSVGNAQVSQRIAATVILVRNVESSRDAVIKFIHGIDWDFAEVGAVTNIVDGSTRLPATQITINVDGTYMFDSYVFELEQNTYAIVWMTENKKSINTMMKNGYDTILSTFRKF